MMESREETPWRSASDGFCMAGFYVIDERQAHHDDDHAEQQCAEDGGEFLLGVHASVFLFYCRAKKGPRDNATVRSKSPLWDWQSLGLIPVSILGRRQLNRTIVEN